MSIAILFESQEWSSFALYEDVRRYLPGVQVNLYDLETAVDEEQILESELIVSRIFASAQFRGHDASLQKVISILNEAEDRGIPLLNSRAAHFYEINKHLAAQVLNTYDLPAPKVYGCRYPRHGYSDLEVEYPLIIKPNCGGRTTDTHVVWKAEYLPATWQLLDPDVEFVIESYIKPKEDYITRIEVIGGKCVQLLKKTLTDSGLAAYHLGSRFTDYSDCPAEVQKLAIDTMNCLDIQMGSLDIIESADGNYVIDVNSVSNYAEENIEMFHFDLIDDTAQFIAQTYQSLRK